MCGIFGRIGRGPAAPLKSIALSSMSRGRDAGGFAWRDSGVHRYMRRPGAIRKLLGHLPAGVLNSEVIIGHTRLATTGDPDRNINNHPFGGSRWMIVHNGWVFNYKNYASEGECDSESILTVLEEHKKASARTAISHVAKELAGSFACAAMDNRDPCHVYLWRQDNPIHYAQMENCFVFASEERFIRIAYPEAVTQSLPWDVIARVGRSGITHMWDLPEGPGGLYRGGYSWQDWEEIDEERYPDRIRTDGTLGMKTRAIRVVNDARAIAYFSEWQYDPFCPRCANLASELVTQLTPIYSRKHWILTEISNMCTCCGEEI